MRLDGAGQHGRRRPRLQGRRKGDDGSGTWLQPAGEDAPDMNMADGKGSAPQIGPSKRTAKIVNARICQAADSGDTRGLLDFVIAHASSLSLVNLSTAWQKLARLERQGCCTLEFQQPRLGFLLDHTSKTLSAQMDGGDHADQPRCWATIAWALAALPRRDNKIHQALSVISQLATPRIAGFKPLEITNMLWAFAKVGHCDRAIFEAVHAHLDVHMKEFSSSKLSTLMWSFATAQFLPSSTMYRMVENYAKDQANEAGNPVALANFLWALATSKMHPKTRVLKDVGQKAASLLPQFKVQELSITAWALSRLGARHDNFFLAVTVYLEENPKILRQLHPQGAANLIWSFERQSHLGAKPIGNRGISLLLSTCVRLLKSFKPQELQCVLSSIIKSGIVMGTHPDADRIFAGVCQSSSEPLREMFMRLSDAQRTDLQRAFCAFGGPYNQELRCKLNEGATSDMRHNSKQQGVSSMGPFQDDFGPHAPERQHASQSAESPMPTHYDVDPQPSSYDQFIHESFPGHSQTDYRVQQPDPMEYAHSGHNASSMQWDASQKYRGRNVQQGPRKCFPRPPHAGHVGPAPAHPINQQFNFRADAPHWVQGDDQGFLANAGFDNYMHADATNNVDGLVQMGPAPGCHHSDHALWQQTFSLRSSTGSADMQFQPASGYLDGVNGLRGGSQPHPGGHCGAATVGVSSQFASVGEREQPAPHMAPPPLHPAASVCHPTTLDACAYAPPGVSTADVFESSTTDEGSMPEDDGYKLPRADSGLMPVPLEAKLPRETSSLPTKTTLAHADSSSFHKAFTDETPVSTRLVVKNTFVDAEAEESAPFRMKQSRFWSAMPSVSFSSHRPPSAERKADLETGGTPGGARRLEAQLFTSVNSCFNSSNHSGSMRSFPCVESSSRTELHVEQHKDHMRAASSMEPELFQRSFASDVSDLVQEGTARAGPIQHDQRLNEMKFTSVGSDSNAIVGRLEAGLTGVRPPRGSDLQDTAACGFINDDSGGRPARPLFASDRSDTGSMLGCLEAKLAGVGHPQCMSQQGRPHDVLGGSCGDVRMPTVDRLMPMSFASERTARIRCSDSMLSGVSGGRLRSMSGPNESKQPSPMLRKFEPQLVGVAPAPGQPRMPNQGLFANESNGANAAQGRLETELTGGVSALEISPCRFAARGCSELRLSKSMFASEGSKACVTLASYSSQEAAFCGSAGSRDGRVAAEVGMAEIACASTGSEHSASASRLETQLARIWPPRVDLESASAYGAANEFGEAKAPTDERLAKRSVTSSVSESNDALGFLEASFVGASQTRGTYHSHASSSLPLPRQENELQPHTRLFADCFSSGRSVVQAREADERNRSPVYLARLTRSTDDSDAEGDNCEPVLVEGGACSFESRTSPAIQPNRQNYVVKNTFVEVADSQPRQERLSTARFFTESAARVLVSEPVKDWLE